MQAPGGRRVAVELERNYFVANFYDIVQISIAIPWPNIEQIIQPSDHTGSGPGPYFHENVANMMAKLRLQ